MAFRDLTDVLGVTPDKVLPIEGHDVAFPARISAWAGTMLLAIQEAALRKAESGVDPSSIDLDDLVTELAMQENDALDLEREILGDGAEQLAALGVIGEARQHVINTLMAWHLRGREAAEAVWDPPEGKAPALNRATRRATAGRSSTTGGTARGRSRTAGGASSAAPKRTRASGGGSGSSRSGRS